MTYSEAIAYLYQLEHFGVKWGLDNIRFLLDRLGHPETGFRAIHVAGTNGKGSVCAYLTAILLAAGYRVGTYVSPHLVDYRERIALNGKLISEDDVARLVERVKPIVDARGATYFEATTAIAYSYFAEQALDIAVIEVGLGGRLDSTNVITPLVSVITEIDLEHTNVLGHTLTQIAWEKGGIIKPNVPVVSASAIAEVRTTLQNLSMERQAPFLALSDHCQIRNINVTRFGTLFDTTLAGEPLPDVTAALIGTYQPVNAMTAVLALHQLSKTDFPITIDHIRQGLANAKWPGRFQIVRDQPLVVLDGAHNPHGIRGFVDTYQTLWGDRKAIVICAVLSTKEHKPMLDSLWPLAKKIILPRIAYHRRKEPETLKMDLPPDITIPVEIEDSTVIALNQALAQADPDDIICVVGSLYLVGEALVYFDALDKR